MYFIVCIDPKGHGQAIQEMDAMVGEALWRVQTH